VRSELSGERLDLLRANRVLYYRDETEKLMQAYTRSFRDLFFFEIVGRHGYKGFGAINA
jgi:4-hydroxyphenylpyruvate dioxygenase